MTFELFSLQKSEGNLNEERKESTGHWGMEETQLAKINRKRTAGTLDRAVPNDHLQRVLADTDSSKSVQ